MSGSTGEASAGAYTDKRPRETNVTAWVIIHWFELGTLLLLCLNLWFVSSVLNALRETNRWIAFLSRIQWEQTHESAARPAPS
jgi:hypothetical protein